MGPVFKSILTRKRGVDNAVVKGLLALLQKLLRFAKATRNYRKSPDNSVRSNFIDTFNIYENILLLNYAVCVELFRLGSFHLPLRKNLTPCTYMQFILSAGTIWGEIHFWTKPTVQILSSHRSNLLVWFSNSFTRQ